MSDQVSEPIESARKANAGALTRLLDLGNHPARAWDPDELAAVFVHQMAAPVMVDLGALSASLSAQLRTLTEAQGLLLKSFHDLFAHPRPPLELLLLVKDFAKRNQGRETSSIPNELAMMLYYMSIAAALARWDKRITRLKDAELRAGFEWAASQKWIDDPSRDLLTLALRTIPA